MKIIFVNPPFIHSQNSTMENEFKIPGPIFRPFYRKIPFFLKTWEKFRNKTVRYGIRAGSRWPWTSEIPFPALHFPFHMAYAVSYLKKFGFDVDIYDAIAKEEFSYNKFLKNLQKKKPKIVVIETSTPTFNLDIWLAKKISNFAEVCLAGAHIAIFSKKIIKKYPFVKYLLEGEYILNSLEMVKNKRPGIYKNKVVEDLDSIPYPYRDYPEATKYFDPGLPTPKPQLQMYASKGCPYNCIYCLWPQVMYKQKVSYRNPKKVALEIKECIYKYGYKGILFDDDTFNIGNQRVSKLCDELKKINLPWTMMGRLDCSPNWLFDKMIDSGCIAMRFGLETFNKKVLKRINKGLENFNILKTLKRLVKKYPKTVIYLTIMKNLPCQTEEIHAEDIKILNNLGFKIGNKYRNYQISSCVPFPGTKLYYELIKNKNINQLINNFNLYDGSLDTIMTKYEKNK